LLVSSLEIPGPTPLCFSCESPFGSISWLHPMIVDFFPPPSRLVRLFPSFNMLVVRCRLGSFCVADTSWSQNASVCIASAVVPLSSRPPFYAVSLCPIRIPSFFCLRLYCAFLPLLPMFQGDATPLGVLITFSGGLCIPFFFMVKSPSPYPSPLQVSVFFLYACFLASADHRVASS